MLPEGRDQKKTRTRKELGKRTWDRSQGAEASHVLWPGMNGKASQPVIQYGTMLKLLKIYVYTTINRYVIKNTPTDTCIQTHFVFSV